MADARLTYDHGVPNDPQPQDAADETPVPTSEPAAAEPAEPAAAEPALDARGVPIPSEQELAAVAQPATVRHAPKFGAFIMAGALVGAVVGLLLTVVVEPALPRAADGSGFISFLDGEGAVRTWMAVAGAVLGGFVGGLVAVVADRRSVRRATSADV